MTENGAFLRTIFRISLIHFLYNLDLPPAPLIQNHETSFGKYQLTTHSEHFHRIHVSGDNEEFVRGVDVDDLATSAKSLFEMMTLRMKYLADSLQPLPKICFDYLCHVKENTEDTPENELFFKIGKKILEEQDNMDKVHKDAPYHPPPNNIEISPYIDYEVEAFPDDWSQKYRISLKEGIFSVWENSDSLFRETSICSVPDLDKFLKDHHKICLLTADGPLKTFCYRRLQYLQSKFNLHSLLNDTKEIAAQKAIPHRDFYNCRKIDNHIHAAAAMNQKHLLRFIKSKLKNEPDMIVTKDENGEDMSLSAVFQKLDITSYDINVDVLDVHADRNLFHRFDRFNTKYNPIGQSILRDLFLKTNNQCDGVLFAKLMKEVLSDFHDSKYQHGELRLSVYGRSMDEWNNLAKWAVRHNVYLRGVLSLLRK